MSTIQKNYINGCWVDSKSKNTIPVINPATSRTIGYVPEGCKEDVEEAVSNAADAWTPWRNTPATKRIQYLFKMKQILEAHTDEIAEICTNECGKTFAESKARNGTCCRKY